METPERKELRVGDKVRDAAGITGKLVVLNADGVSAYVQRDDQQRGTVFTLCRLDALTKITAN